MFKKILFQLHWFMGITAGLILSIIGVTGALYSYDSQILKWINPESYTVQVEQREKMTPEQLFTHFSQQHPEIKINSITVSKEPSESSVLNIVKEGERKGYNMMVNPYSAEILPEVQGRQFFNIVMGIHRWLTVGEFGDRQIGKQITGAATLMLIFFVLSGLYLRWPRKHSFRQWFAVKKELSGRNFLWDLHAVVGTWVAIFYLILAVTGLYWSYDWWRNGMFKVLGVTPPSAQQKAEKPKEEKNAQDKDKVKPAPINAEQIQLALTLTWDNARSQLGRDYSAITFNLPKQADGKIDISYVDAVPQHERARNSVKFDYESNQIVKHEIYENKKLNEKIMSSMLPVHRGSFFGSTYQFFAMLASLAMPLFFITGWILYVKRRKQKQQTKQAMLAATALTTNQTAKGKADWLIVYATQSGTAEQLAWQTSSSLQSGGQTVAVKAIQDINEYDLMEHTQALFIASTFGTGEAPDLAMDFVNITMEQQLSLQHMKFAVLALGSKEYEDTFCMFGHNLAAWLEYCDAQPLFDTIEVDNANPNDIQRWNNALAQVTQLQLADIELNKDFHTWTLLQRDVLNPESQGNLAFNIELSNTENLSWNAGDIAEIKTGNSQQRISDFMTRHQLEGASIAGQLKHKDLTVNITSFNQVDDLIAQLPDLPTREYSIANIPTVGQANQRLRLVVRQHKDNAGELGLGSGYLTQHLAINDTLDVYIRNNTSFNLIEDERPIICIGNGTGIAGLMSLLHSREQKQHHQNWLIFGEREKAKDFFYQEQLQKWLDTGVLSRLDTAFSRDQAEKIYVQDIVRQQAEQIKTWINDGAVIYVCGSIEGMASGVDSALIDVLGATKVNELRQQNRYRRDVY